ncbi:MAG: hypothetical protein J6A22_00575 [Bacteroidales bacterium]|nr:hypothetical protein [Bacteroidales bacterium]
MAAAFGVFAAGCVPETEEPGDDSQNTDKPVTPEDSTDVSKPVDKATFAVAVENVGVTTADLVITSKGISAVSYVVQDTEVPNSVANVISRLGTKVDVTEEKTVINLSGFDANVKYYVYVVAFVGDAFHEDVYIGDFTTIDYNFTQLLTITEKYHDGFRARITVPASVKEDESRAIRYTVSTLPLYLQKREDPYFNDFNSLEENGQQHTREDLTIIYNDDNQYVDEEGNPVPENEFEAGVDIQLHNKFAPGEPIVLLAGEFSEEESQYGWGIGYYQPLFDSLRYFVNEPPQVSVLASPWEKASASDSYWTGAFQKELVVCNPPVAFDGDVSMEVIECGAIDATLRFTPSDNVVQYCVAILDETNYNLALNLIDKNPDYFQWFVTSYYAFWAGLSTSLFGPTDLHLSDVMYASANTEYRVFVTAMGDEEGTTQFFKTFDIKTTDYQLALPEIQIRPIDSNSSPYFVSFNIKAPNKDVKTAVYAANYVRDFEMMLNAGNTYNQIVEGGNRFTTEEVAQINSDEGYTITISSVPGEVTRLAVLAYNSEERSNVIEPKDVADCSTAQLPRKPVITTDYYNTLPGEWTATATIESYYDENGLAEYDNETGEYKKFTFVKTADITICKEIDYPSPMPSEVYDIYKDEPKEEVDALYREFCDLAAVFNQRQLQYQNRLLCIGFIDHDPGMKKASPWDLFVSEDYVGYDVSGIFYDFGPKWFLEMIGDENYEFDKVVIPYNTVRMAPFNNWDRGYMYNLLPYSRETNIAIGSVSSDGSLDGHIPVEISPDGNTITIKPVVSNGQNYYPTPMYYKYGEPSARSYVVSDIVLTRGTTKTKSGYAAGSASSAVSRTASARNLDGSVSVFSSPVRTSVMTPLKPVKAIEYKKVEHKMPTAEYVQERMRELAERY